MKRTRAPARVTTSPAAAEEAAIARALAEGARWVTSSRGAILVGPVAHLLERSEIAAAYAGRILTDPISVEGNA